MSRAHLLCVSERARERERERERERRLSPPHVLRAFALFSLREKGWTKECTNAKPNTQQMKGKRVGQHNASGREPSKVNARGKCKQMPGERVSECTKKE